MAGATGRISSCRARRRAGSGFCSRARRGGSSPQRRRAFDRSRSFCWGSALASVRRLISNGPSISIFSAAKVMFRVENTKAGKPRLVDLSPALVATLANLPHRDGKVFRSHLLDPETGERKGYADRRREGGGQIKTAWIATLKRAELSNLTPHDLRHTWATWHYAIHRDPFRLRDEGGWSSVALVERYSHGSLFPRDQIPRIAEFWDRVAVLSPLAPCENSSPERHQAAREAS